MSTEQHYADRNHEAQGLHYITHVSAMTAEGLHRKSAIAAELAHRDIEIARLKAENATLQSGCGAARLEIESLQSRLIQVTEQHRLWFARSQELEEDRKRLAAENHGLRAARIAYASEFAPDADGEHDTGNIHQNIRALKAECAQYRSQRDELMASLEAFLRAPSIGSNGPGSSTIVVQDFNLRAASAVITKIQGGAA